MIWIINVELVVLLTAITGSMLTLIWIAVVKLFGAHVSPCIIYRLLRLAMLGYVMPTTYLLVKWRAYYHYIGVGYWFETTPLLSRIANVCFGVWVIGIIAYAVSQMTSVHALRVIRSNVSRAPVWVQEQLQIVRSQLKIRRKITICQGVSVMSPFICGFIRPKIYLPECNFEGKELQMILTHECNHFKQRDVFWKPFFIAINAVFWFNPLAWYTSRMMRCWAEASCDMRSQCGEWSRSEYFDAILRLLDKNQQRITNFASMWCESERELVWRIQCMKKYKDRVVKKRFVALALIVTLLTGSVSVYAVDNGVNQLYESAYWNTVSASEEDASDGSELVEYTGDMSDFGDLFPVQELTSQIATASTTTLIDWTVGAHMMYKSSEFTKSKGGTITVTVSVTPSDKYVYVGIRCPGGSTIYVNSKGVITHTFTCPSSGTYLVYVANRNSTKIKADGCYIK
jgi:beta-lactamase regulating signal transducer with metallopeptidase domain